MAFAEYIAGQRRRRQVEGLRAQARAVLARELAGRIAAVLFREFGATRVVLFGSLASGRFDARSDIDIAAAGIDPARFFAAAAAAQRHGEPVDVDLVPLETASPLLRAHVDNEGVELRGN